MDSVGATLSLPLHNIHSIRKELRRALDRPHMTVRQLARIIGLLTASIQAIFPDPLHYWNLQRLKIAHLREGASYADRILLDTKPWSDLWLCPRAHDRLRHVHFRLGCALHGSLHGRQLDPPRTDPPYQCIGSFGRILCQQEFHQRQGGVMYTPLDGQCVASLVCEPSGWHPVPGIGPSGVGLLDILF